MPPAPSRWGERYIYSEDIWLAWNGAAQMGQGTTESIDARLGHVCFSVSLPLSSNWRGFGNRVSRSHWANSRFSFELADFVWIRNLFEDLLFPLKKQCLQGAFWQLQGGTKIWSLSLYICPKTGAFVERASRNEAGERGPSSSSQWVLSLCLLPLLPFWTLLILWRTLNCRWSRPGRRHYLLPLFPNIISIYNLLTSCCRPSKLLGQIYSRI